MSDGQMGRGARRTIAPRAAATVGVALAVLLAAEGVAAQSWRDVTMSRQLENTDPVTVDVRYGAGTFRLSSTDERLLYRMTLRYDEEAFEPLAEYDGDRLRLGVETVGRGFHMGRNRDEGSMELQLGRGVPMDLDLEFGAVKAEVDLGGLALRELDLATGASEAAIEVSEPNPARMGRGSFEVGAADFTLRGVGNLGADRIEVHAGVGSVTLSLDGQWRSDARVSIDMGLGSLELRIPEGLGVQIRKNSFLTSFDSQELVRRGEAYYSLDWEHAERKITIDLDAAFGSVRVTWIR